MSKKVYVEQSAVLEALQATINKQTGKPDALQFVSDILDAPFVPPPADVKPVVRGEWVHRKVRHSLPWDCPPYYGEEYDRESHSCLEDEWHCSNCDYETDDIDKEWWHFCPNCGADMIAEVNDER